MESESIKKSLLARRRKSTKNCLPKVPKKIKKKNFPALLTYYSVLGFILWRSVSPVSLIMNDFLFLCFAFYSILLYFTIYVTWFICKASSAKDLPHQQQVIPFDTIKSLVNSLDFANIEKLLKNEELTTQGII